MKIISALMTCVILFSILLVSGCTTPPVPDVELSNAKISPSSGQAGQDIFTITADYLDEIVPYNPIPNFGNETCDYKDVMRTTTIIVRADNSANQLVFCTWTDTGLTVGPGYTLDITATGEWQVNENPASKCGADGLTGSTVDRFCDDAWTGALIGYIGATPPEPGSGLNWTTFGVGARYSDIVGGGQLGELWLGINDDANTGTYYDNEGELNVDITVALSTLNDEHPRLAVDSQGDVRKVWMAEVSPDHWEIFYAELIGEGPAQRVYEQIAAVDSYNSTYPSIALDSNDNSHVVWIDFWYDGFAAIYYNIVEDNTGSCYYDGSSSSRPSNRKISYGGMLASFDSGRAVGFNVPGATVDSPTNPLYIEHPDIAVDSEDQVHIVWSDNRKKNGNTDGHWEVYYNRINNDGTYGPGTGTLQFSQRTNPAYPNDLLLTDPTTAGGNPTDPCSPKADNSDSMCPAIACSGHSLHIAWQDYRDTPFPGSLLHCWEIYYQQRNSDDLSSILSIQPWERIASHYDANYDSAIPPGLEFNYSGLGDPGSDGYSSVSPDIGVERGCKKTVVVTPNPLWTDTGCTVEVDDLVDITASGNWSGYWGQWYGPDGQSATTGWYDNFYSGANHAALIAFVGANPYKPDGDHDWDNSIWPNPVGDNGGYFPIGSGSAFCSDRQGKLWLGYNDDAQTHDIGDNVGNVTANITVSRRVEITWMDQRASWWQGWQYDWAVSSNNIPCDTQVVNGRPCWEVYIAVLYPCGQLSDDPFIGGLAIKRESDMSPCGGLGLYTGPVPDDNSMYPRMAVEPVLTDTSQTHIAWHDYRDGNCSIYYKHIPSWCKNPNPDKWVTSDSEEDMYPDVALQQLLGGYRACIKWQSDRSGSWRIYDNHRISKKDKDAAYMYVEIQPEGQPYPTDVMTFDMHPLVPSQNVTIGVLVTYGCTFILSTPGDYQFRIQARDSAGYECTTDWMTGPAVNAPQQ